MDRSGIGIVEGVHERKTGDEHSAQTIVLRDADVCMLDEVERPLQDVLPLQHVSSAQLPFILSFLHR